MQNARGRVKKLKIKFPPHAKREGAGQHEGKRAMRLLKTQKKAQTPYMQNEGGRATKVKLKN